MRSSAIIIQDNKILLIHRFRDGEEYYVFPGGAVEANETPEQAVIREIKEETNLDAEIERKLWEHENDYDKRTYVCYLITKFKGKLELGGPEVERSSEENKYILEWHKISEIKNLPLYPENIKNKVIEEF